jgi:hypothetical protein
MSEPTLSLSCRNCIHCANPNTEAVYCKWLLTVMGNAGMYYAHIPQHLQSQVVEVKPSMANTCDAYEARK